MIAARRRRSSSLVVSLVAPLLAFALVAAQRGAARAQAVVQQQQQTVIIMNAPPPPPQPVYVPPPQPVFVQPVRDLPPKSGVGDIVAGSVLLPLGVALIGGSVPLWYKSSEASVIGAATLDVAGIAMAITGLVEIPIGVVRLVKRRKWDEQHAIVSTLRPTVAPTAERDGAIVGLGFRM